MAEAIQIKNKLESYAAIDNLKEDVNYFIEKYTDDDTVPKNVKKIVNNIEAGGLEINYQ